MREVNMASCRRIRPWLEWLAAGEIDDRRRLMAEAHLRVCPDCHRELSRWQALLAAARRRAAAAKNECQMIDWDAVSEKIIHRLDGSDKIIAMPLRRRFFTAKPLLSAAGLLLFLLVGAFFLTRTRSLIPVGMEGPGISAAAVSHLHSGLGRQEVVSYLRQSQLMFTDLLKDCRHEEVASWEIDLYSRQAKKLLLKKKYVQQTLPAMEWSRVRTVCERIDWLSYEILLLESQQFCGQLGRLQRIMESEKLLLKIRLLEREFSLPSYQEV